MLLSLFGGGVGGSLWGFFFGLFFFGKAPACSSIPFSLCEHACNITITSCIRGVCVHLRAFVDAFHRVLKEEEVRVKVYNPIVPRGTRRVIGMRARQHEWGNLLPNQEDTDGVEGVGEPHQCHRVDQKKRMMGGGCLVLGHVEQPL